MNSITEIYLTIKYYVKGFHTAPYTLLRNVSKYQRLSNFRVLQFIFFIANKRAKLKKTLNNFVDNFRNVRSPLENDDKKL